MIAYVEIGKRIKWARKQYRCMEFKDHASGRTNCESCDLLMGDVSACQFTACMNFERTDKKDVFFRLEPRFRKEE